MPSQGEPTRDEVFAFIDAVKGRGAADAVAHFAGEGRTIAGSKIRVWLTRRNAAATRPGVAPVAPTAARSGEKSANNRAAAATSSANASAPKSRAAPRLDVDNLDADVATAYRNAVLHRINWLANPDSLESTRQKDVAVALGILVDKAPGIIDAGRDGKGQAGPTEAEMEALDGAMLGPPPLRVVETKKGVG